MLLLTLWGVPYVHFLLAGFTAAFVALVRSSLEGKPPTFQKRLLDAILCGMGAFSITWLAWRYSDGLFSFEDSIPYAIPIGFFGAGRVFERLARRYIDPVDTK